MIIKYRTCFYSILSDFICFHSISFDFIRFHSFLFDFIRFILFYSFSFWTYSFNRTSHQPTRRQRPTSAASMAATAPTTASATAAATAVRATASAPATAIPAAASPSTSAAPPQTTFSVLLSQRFFITGRHRTLGHLYLPAPRLALRPLTFRLSFGRVRPVRTFVKMQLQILPHRATLCHPSHSDHPRFLDILLFCAPP